MTGAGHAAGSAASQTSMAVLRGLLHGRGLVQVGVCCELLPLPLCPCVASFEVAQEGANLGSSSVPM